MEHNVAGLPAGARAVHALTSLNLGDAVRECTLNATGEWTPSGSLIVECERLAPGIRLSFSSAVPHEKALIIRGEAFVEQIARRHGQMDRGAVLIAMTGACTRRTRGDIAEGEAFSQLRRAGVSILKATGKAGDGIVSRHVNRPISRAISHRLLRVRGMEPSHASAGTALIGLSMLLSLLVGGDAGLIVGALLFQAASIFDGVDGEMARATFRTSREGASLDSIIDACTNLAFITGVTINVWLAGDVVAAKAGAASLLILSTGLMLIGRRSKAEGESVNFETVKRHLRGGGRRSAVVECLIHMTMRDFYAAACAIMIVAGQSHLVLLAFATVTAGWFIVTTFALARNSALRISIPASWSHRRRRGGRVMGDKGQHLGTMPRSRRI